MNYEQHARSVIKGIIKDLKQAYGNGWQYLHSRQKEAEVWARILGVMLGQDEDATWGSLLPYCQRLIAAAGELLEGEP